MSAFRYGAPHGGIALTGSSGDADDRFKQPARAPFWCGDPEIWAVGTGTGSAEATGRIGDCYQSPEIKNLTGRSGRRVSGPANDLNAIRI